MRATGVPVRTGGVCVGIAWTPASAGAVASGWVSDVTIGERRIWTASSANSPVSSGPARRRQDERLPVAGERVERGAGLGREQDGVGLRADDGQRREAAAVVEVLQHDPRAVPREALRRAARDGLRQPPRAGHHLHHHGVAGRRVGHEHAGGGVAVPVGADVDHRLDARAGRVHEARVEPARRAAADQLHAVRPLEGDLLVGRLAGGQRSSGSSRVAVPVRPGGGASVVASGWVAGGAAVLVNAGVASVAAPSPAEPPALLPPATSATAAAASRAAQAATPTAVARAGARIDSLYLALGPRVPGRPGAGGLRL